MKMYKYRNTVNVNGTQLMWTGTQLMYTTTSGLELQQNIYWTALSSKSKINGPEVFLQKH